MTRACTTSAAAPLLKVAPFLVVAVLVLAGCSAGGEDSGKDPAPSGSATTGHAHHTEAGEPEATPLRADERFLDVAMPTAYTPKAPYGAGTDDYRCFVLDPKLRKDAFLTGIDVRPGNADVVHHVILFSVAPGQRAEARARDAEEAGPGWTCFGGTGLGADMGTLDQAPWIGAWAPGGGEQVHAGDVGVPLARGSQIVMQVHYNLLAGKDPDTSSARLRLAPGTAALDPLETVLLPAPVELPCRPGRSGSLCEREAAVADAVKRFGNAGRIAEYFPFLCGAAEPGPEQSCTRRARKDMTIRAAAGHMHLLGREISIAVNGETVLDIDEWNFDDQGAVAVDPVSVKAGDELTVTCRHDQAMRDINPSLEGQPERYVVWGEGTTDEMCLGILLATRR
jgi:hypothetical protein